MSELVGRPSGTVTFLFTDQCSRRNRPNETDIHLGKRHRKNIAGPHFSRDSNTTVKHCCHDAALNPTKLVGPRVGDFESKRGGPGLVVHFNNFARDAGELHRWRKDFTLLRSSSGLSVIARLRREYINR
jgi:hypothetical protein